MSAAQLEGVNGSFYMAGDWYSFCSQRIHKKEEPTTRPDVGEEVKYKSRMLDTAAAGPV